MEADKWILIAEQLLLKEMEGRVWEKEKSLATTIHASTILMEDATLA